jgi:glyoxylase-like metal-dependent hydrolase (beta-lactamase superfamily II)
MSREQAHWTVLDEKNVVLTSTYFFNPPEGSANTFVARILGGGLMVVSPPVGATEELFSELAKYGEVKVIVAPNGFHHLGLRVWRDRFPKARVFAPSQAFARIARRNKKAGEFESFDALQPLLGPDVVVAEGPSTKCGESWCCVRGENGYIWFVSDILANMPKLPSNFIVRQIFKWTGSGPGYRLFNLALKFIVADKKHFLRTLLAAMEERPPAVVVPAHGDILQHANLAAETKALLASAL